MRLTLQLVLLAALTGCDTPPPEAPPAPTPPTAAEVKAPPVGPLSVGALAAAEPVALVPSPLEMQAALKRSGLLGPQGLLVKPRGRSRPPGKTTTGSRFAPAWPSPTSCSSSRPPRPQSSSGCSRRSAAGLVALGAKEDALSALDELTAQVQNEALTRDALVQELDALSGGTLPELEAQLGPRAVPLIRAGSWLEGANLVSSSIIAGGNYDTATDLLRHPGVVAWFQRYVEETPAWPPRPRAARAYFARVPQVPRDGHRLRASRRGRGPPDSPEHRRRARSFVSEGPVINPLLALSLLVAPARRRRARAPGLRG
jgi:hypothetical protein